MDEFVVQFKNGKGGAARFEGREKVGDNVVENSLSFDFVAGAAARWRQRR